MAGKKELLQFSDKLRIAEKMHADEIAKVKADCEQQLKERPTQVADGS